MTRKQKYLREITPTGRWINKFCRSSDSGLCVSNLDFVICDYKNKKIMIMESKKYLGPIHWGQAKLFELIDRILTIAVITKNSYFEGWEYWGFYVLQLSRTSPRNSNEMYLNQKLITRDELKDHVDFKAQFCPAFRFDRAFNGGGKGIIVR